MGYGTHKVQSQEKKEGMSNIFTGSEELRVLGIKGNFHGCESTLLCFLKNQSKHIRTGEEGTCKGIMLGKVVFMVVCMYIIVPYTRVEVQS